MRLIPIAEHNEAARILYDLLAERTPEQSISHTRMPTWEEHLRFIGVSPGHWASGRFHPYQSWELIEVDGRIVGAIYLTHAFEIGISIFRHEQSKGYGLKAISMMMERHKGSRLLANINPANEASRRMFEKLGFNLVQHTLALEPQ